MTAHTSIKPADRRMVALVLAIVTVTLVALGFIFAQGSDTQRAVQLQQHEGLERAECVTEYRTEWQNAVGDIVLVAARGNDPTPAQVRALARAQRHSSQVNQRCDATQPGGVRLP